MTQIQTKIIAILSSFQSILRPTRNAHNLRLRYAMNHVAPSPRCKCLISFSVIQTQKDHHYAPPRYCSQNVNRMHCISAAQLAVMANHLHQTRFLPSPSLPGAARALWSQIYDCLDRPHYCGCNATNEAHNNECNPRFVASPLQAHALFHPKTR
eukprot:273285_1